MACETRGRYRTTDRHVRRERDAFPRPKVLSLPAPRITIVSKPVEAEPVPAIPLNASPPTHSAPPAVADGLPLRHVVSPTLPPFPPVLTTSLSTSLPSVASSDPQRLSLATSGPPQSSPVVPTPLLPSPPLITAQPRSASQDLPPTPISARFESNRDRLSRQGPTPEPTPEVESRSAGSGPEYFLPFSLTLLEPSRIPANKALSPQWNFEVDRDTSSRIKRFVLPSSSYLSALLTFAAVSVPFLTT